MRFEPEKWKEAATNQFYDKAPFFSQLFLAFAKKKIPKFKYQIFEKRSNPAPKRNINFYCPGPRLFIVCRFRHLNVFFYFPPILNCVYSEMP